MSLINTLQSGASGLTAIGASLGVIGDNIANINTTGYKGSRANFADLMPQFLGGAGQVGRGTQLSNVSRSFGQGALQATGSVLDVGVQGNGWFKVNNGGEAFYTRDGHFNLDKDNFVVSSSGLNLQGYQASNGVVTSTLGDLQLDTGDMMPQVTSTITLDANLAIPDPANSNGDLLALDFTGGATIAEMSGAADFSTSVTVYDTLGRPHDVSVMYEYDQTAGSWNYKAVIDAGDTDMAGATPGNGVAILEGTVSFDTSGQLASVTQTTPATMPAWTWPGAAPFSFTLDMGVDSTGAATNGSLTQVGLDGTSATNAISQDGFTVGAVTGLQMSADGTIVANFDNGQDRLIGQLALARFAAEGGLEGMGGNLFRASMASGEAAMGAAGVGGRGDTIAYALEGSNVSLEDEFVQMIQAQRAYQANAGTIRTADETLQELVNLV